MSSRILGKERRGQGLGWAKEGRQVSRLLGRIRRGGDQLLQRHQGEKHIVFTLYRCTTYQLEAYRVHIADEGNPANPIYKLLPVAEDPHVQGAGPEYTEPWDKDQVAARYPLFLKNMDYFDERRVDPSLRGL
jgi:hypothetical protein